jgi:hypothetical protein
MVQDKQGGKYFSTSRKQSFTEQNHLHQSQEFDVTSLTRTIGGFSRNNFSPEIIQKEHNLHFKTAV